MRFPDFFRGLSDQQRERYADRAGTTVEYIRVHLIRAKRIPRPDLMDSLVQASAGAVSRKELLDHFYPPSAEASRKVAVP